MAPIKHINLYHDVFRPRRIYLSARRMVAAWVLFMLGLAIMAGLKAWQAEKLAAQVTAVRRHTEIIEARLVAQTSGHTQTDAALKADIHAMQARLDSLGRIEQALRSGAAGAPGGWSILFEALTRVYIPGLWLTGVRVEGNDPTMTLRGRSLDGTAPVRYIALLRREPSLSGLQFMALKIAEPERHTDQAGESVPAGLEFVLSGRPMTEKHSDVPKP